MAKLHVRYYPLEERSVLQMLRWQENWPDCLMVGKVVGPPEGSTIAWIHADTLRQSVMVAVSHPNFDAVPEGADFPVAQDLCTIKFEMLGRQQDGSYRITDDPAFSPIERWDGLSTMSDSQLDELEESIKEVRYDRDNNRASSAIQAFAEKVVSGQ